MNERERFEEKYIKQFINTPIEKTGLSYEMAKWGWQARAEIAKQDEKKLIEALKRADNFITNGIEFGFIHLPDENTDDQAKETPRIIKAILKTHKQNMGGKNE